MIADILVLKLSVEMVKLKDIQDCYSEDVVGFKDRVCEINVFVRH